MLSGAGTGVRVRPAYWPLLTVGVIIVLGLLVAAAVPAALRPAPGAGMVTISAVAPADGARLPLRPLTISAEVSGEQPLQRVSLRLDDAEVTPLHERLDARRWKISYTLRDAGLEQASRNGEQRVSLLARDVHGRQTSRDWRFRIDPALSAPVFSELQPPEGGYGPAGGLRLSAIVQADAPIASAMLELDGQPMPVTVEPAAATRATVATRLDLKPGRHEARLAVTDRDGDRGMRAWLFTVPDPRELLAFEQTGKAIGGGFRRFWQEKGGLEIFGLPISDEVREGNATVQYFERARFEYQPSRDGLLSEVQLGLVGREARQPDPSRVDPGGDARFFPETGQAITGPFRRYWEEKGGLAIFGLPITAETRDGSATVQYFERARFEQHPGRSGVTLGTLGRELYERRYPPPTPRPTS
ncbi:MAG: hypothetical protein IT340_13505 [Chloroflexi bacterium]|nr:hypothetical protein [Chloroflexota bacterium]